MNDGTVTSFGEGSHGELGHGDHTDQLSPKVITALGTNAQACSAGEANTTHAWQHTHYNVQGKGFWYHAFGCWVCGACEKQQRFQPPQCLLCLHT
jgi:hypothetical protein